MADEGIRGHLATMFPAEYVPGFQFAHGKGLEFMQTVKLTHHEIEQVIEFMHQACGNDYSEKNALISSKMSMLCMRLGYNHFYEMWDDATASTIASAQLRQQIIDALTTNYSYFFREDVHFARLTDFISAGHLPVGMGEMRVWSAGCASGEEPYNLAMVLEDAHRSGLMGGSYRVIGSDISSHAIAIAREGRYDVADVARMPPHWRTRYCVRSGADYEVKKLLRDRVEFRLENVLAPRFDAPFDVVMCRNMMIYFDKESIGKFCSILRNRVKPGGYLFLGHAEIISDLPGFTYLEPSIWQREATGSTDFLGSLVNFGVAGNLS